MGRSSGWIDKPEPRIPSWPLWNLQPALHRGPRQAARKPGRDVGERIERDQFARAVEADEVTHPADQRDVGDGVFVVHDPLPVFETPFEHIQQAPGFRDIALERTLVGDVLTGEFMEEA